MTQNNSYSLHKRRYAQISTKKRQALVRLVIQEGKTLSEAGRKLHVNPSTARLIIKKYKETGTYFQKKLRNTPKLNQQEAVSQSSAQVYVKAQEKELINGVEPQQQVIKEECKQNSQVQAKPNQKYTYPFIQYFYPI